MADSEISTKRCTKCEQILPHDGFGKSTQTKDGLYGWCRECRKAAGRAYAAAHSTQNAARAKAWDAENREWRREYRHRHYIANKDLALAQVKEWRQTNLARYWASEKQRYWRNRSAILARKRICAAAWRLLNPERVREIQRAAYRKNPAIWKAARDRYRAKKRGADGNYGKSDILRIYSAQRGRCAYCRVRLDNSFHIDHIKPISRGGSNNPSNLQLTCAPCNLRKKDKDPITFSQQLGRLL